MSSSKILVIVESPAKCSKIQSYLGANYIVKASFGHIRNIDKKKGLSAIDINNNYSPSFSVIAEKRKYVTDLQNQAKSCKEVIIASDLDREGEAIGYHLVHVLKLDITKTKRIVFNEITKKAINDAIQNPRLIDMNLVNAQLARQILDYMIGFDISPILWKHIKNNLSAGRCQSPSLKLINTKETEVIEFQSNTYFDLEGSFTNINDIVFSCRSKNTLKNRDKAVDTFQEFKNANFSIKSTTITESISKPSSPYITSTIQQDASSKLGLSPKVTMSVLQKLYESGKITYMRTDSKILSDQCRNNIKDYIIKNYNDKYHYTRQYKNNSKNAQEAHECIRPVDIDISEISDGFSSTEERLYDLIWKRTVASQMAEMVTQIYKVVIQNNSNKILFESSFEKTLFLGYGIIYDYSEIDEIGPIKDKIEEKQDVFIQNIYSSERLTSPPSRYTEASLIKDLEKKGIGRPSTYSSILDTLFKRDYIIKDSRTGEDTDMLIISLNKDKNIKEDSKKIKTNKEVNKIFITELGKIVIEFMDKHFTQILDAAFTADMENNLDEIAKGNFDWVSLIDNIYKSFHPIVDKLSKQQTEISWKEKNKRPVITINPINNKPIYCYKGKYGPVIQEGVDSDCRYIGLPKDFDLVNVDIEHCIYLTTFPKIIGEINKTDVEVNYGSNGFYVKYNGKNYSITNPYIKLSEIESIINVNKKTVLKEFSGGISIRDGKYGPYIMKAGKKNKIVSVPPQFKEDPCKLTLKECNVCLRDKN